jgi:sodium-dependent dicarboxylate transporter 2/3/5
MARYALKLLAGPLAFAAVLIAPVDLSYQGHVALATFACAIVWWITQPLPWAVAAMLPVLVFPAAGVMDVAATTRLYGQPTFFWIMGTVLMGYAIEKHGVSRRFALAFLALPGVGGRTQRLLFAYMLVVGLVSMCVSDAVTIAMMIPIGMLLVRHVRGTLGAQSGPHANFAAFITLGTLYAAIAGGTATIMGVPHNAIALSALDTLTGRRLGFFEWMTVGLPVFVALLVGFYATLRVLVPPELDEIPGGAAFLRAERAKLGPIGPNERRVLLVLAVMVVLFVFPAAAGLAAGAGHPLTQWANRALPVWVVPPAVMLLLFTIRAAGDSGTALLTWKDAERHAPWGAMLLVTGAMGMTDALTQFGFVEFMAAVVSRLTIESGALPYLVAATVALTTNFIAGAAATALYCSIFIPAASETGYNPASMAILIANVAIGLVFPWAGAAAATAFAGGEITVPRMMRIGLAATLTYALVVATVHRIMEGLI